MGEVARLQTQQISLPPQVRPGLGGTLCSAALDRCMPAACPVLVLMRCISPGCSAHGLEEVAA